MSEIENAVDIIKLGIGDCIKMCASVLGQSARPVFYLQGEPGMGKSHICHTIGEKLGYEPHRIDSLNLTHHDVVDCTGVPEIMPLASDPEVRTTQFAPMDKLMQFRKGTGPGLLIIEELAQSSQLHQTWTAGLVWDRKTSVMELDPEVRIIITGNRAEDRAGAKPLLTHLANRLYCINVAADLEAWSEWAIAAGVHVYGVSFLRLRPTLLNAFDPDQQSNPTQRAWTELFMDIPFDLPRGQYLAAAAGKVGQAAAEEWVSARDLMETMPDPRAVRADPLGHPLPTEPSIEYALVSALATTTDEDMIAKDFAFVQRMGREYHMLYMTDAVSKNTALENTMTFGKFAADNMDVFLGT